MALIPSLIDMTDEEIAIHLQRTVAQPSTSTPAVDSTVPVVPRRLRVIDELEVFCQSPPSPSRQAARPDRQQDVSLLDASERREYRALEAQFQALQRQHQETQAAWLEERTRRKTCQELLETSSGPAPGPGPSGPAPGPGPSGPPPPPGRGHRDRAGSIGTGFGAGPIGTGPPAPGSQAVAESTAVSTDDSSNNNMPSDSEAQRARRRWTVSATEDVAAMIVFSVTFRFQFLFFFCCVPYSNIAFFVYVPFPTFIFLLRFAFQHCIFSFVFRY